MNEFCIEKGVINARLNSKKCNTTLWKGRLISPSKKYLIEVFFQKISSGEISKTAAMMGGGAVFETPLYVFRFIYGMV
jgi:hypothetical protein